jgi:hypothetical protein
LRIAAGPALDIYRGRRATAIESSEPYAADGDCICRLIEDRIIVGYSCACHPTAEKKDTMSFTVEQRTILRNLNVREAEVLARQRRMRVDAVLAARASAGERALAAQMTISHRDLVGRGFLQRHAGGAPIAAHAAVPATALVASACSIARSAGECEDISQGYEKISTAIAFVASAAARAQGTNMITIAAARGAGGRHAIDQGRRLAGEIHRPADADADALLGEALGLLEECEGQADSLENFKKLCVAGALLEMLLDEITPAYTALHPDEIAGAQADERYAMPPIDKMAT